MSKKYVNGELLDMTVEDKAMLAAAQASIAEDMAHYPFRVTTTKGDIWRRLTADQFGVVDAAISALEGVEARLWSDVQYIDHSDAMFTKLKTAMIDAFGVDEAARILAPSE